MSRREPHEEILGEVTVPSGTLVVFDVGACELPSPHAVSCLGVPADRPLPIVGSRVGAGDFARCWRSISVVISDQPVARDEALGEVSVDTARVLFADASVESHWEHSSAIDGRADFVFWGRDASALASEVGAPALDESSFGWLDRPVAEIVEIGERAESIRTARGLKLATDFRPHSHHYQVLAIARTAPTGSGSIDVGPLRVCLAFTSWGDGRFPVVRELGPSGELVRVTVRLETEASVAAMQWVNGR